MKPLQQIWWHKECLEFNHELRMRLIKQRDERQHVIDVIDRGTAYLQRQIAQAEAEGLQEFDPDTYRLKEEAN